MMDANEDKQLLIDSMKKLAAHISNNPKRQLDIFQSLSPTDLQKIILNLQDQHEALRKISAMLLCQMTHRNPQVKKKLVKMLKIEPGEGRICLGGIMGDLGRFPYLLKSCVQLIKCPPKDHEHDYMCWYINLDQPSIQMSLMTQPVTNHTMFPDPKRNIFGITIPPTPTPVTQSPVKHSPEKQQRRPLPIHRNTYTPTPHTQRRYVGLNQRFVRTSQKDKHPSHAQHHSMRQTQQLRRDRIHSQNTPQYKHTAESSERREVFIPAPRITLLPRHNQP